MAIFEGVSAKMYLFSSSSISLSFPSKRATSILSLLPKVFCIAAEENTSSILEKLFTIIIFSALFKNCTATDENS